MPEAPTKTKPDSDVRCPTCGAPAEEGQLICLECGARIALAYRRPPSWRLPAAIVSVIVLAAAAGIYFGIDAITDDAKEEVAARPAPPQRAAAEDEGGGAKAKKNDKGSGENTGANKKADETPAKKKKPPEEETKPPDRTAEAPSVGAGGVRSWPEGEDAFTVVILSSEDRGSARAFAQNAAKRGTKAGVLRADDYPALSASTGFFIVFVGSYPNQRQADRASARLGRRFQGAYPQFVDGSKAKR